MHTLSQEYARAKYAGREWFERHLQSNLRSQEDKRERKRGYREQETAAALKAVTQYGKGRSRRHTSCQSWDVWSPAHQQPVVGS